MSKKNTNFARRTRATKEMFYLILFLILFVLAVLNVQTHDKLSSQLLSGIAAILLIAVAGLRFETGGDWNVYAQLFAEFPSFSQLIGNPSLLLKQPVEEGFVLLCAAVKALGGTIQHLFFVVAFINITLIACALPQYTRYPVVGLLCYFGLLYFHLEMIYIRQATAVALCFFALRYLKPRKLLPYLLIVLLACTFHRVAALMIPLYFVLHAKIPTWIYLAVIGVGAVLMPPVDEHAKAQVAPSLDRLRPCGYRALDKRREIASVIPNRHQGEYDRRTDHAQPLRPQPGVVLLWLRTDRSQQPRASVLLHRHHRLAADGIGSAAVVPGATHRIAHHRLVLLCLLPCHLFGETPSRCL